MSESDKNGAQMLVGEQAADWFVQLKDGALSEDEIRRYLDWLRQSPTHVAEMDRIEQLHGKLKGILLGSK
ncbi:MAG: FecR/PupR family sigma factor regulator [Steroidobacteraceae bacterium]